MTTARQAYEALLIELNKENAPNILLEDFNYLFNKAIYQYTNKRYNIYDISQQTTDDLRVLKATALLDAHKAYGKYKPDSDKPLDASALTDFYPTDEDFGFLGATYEVTLPSDYYHLLNCICIYKVNKTFKCYNAGDYWRRPATRLTADAYSLILDNFYLRPTYKRPYYYIHNVNQLVENPTNSYTDEKDEEGYPKWSGSTDQIISTPSNSSSLNENKAELNEVNSKLSNIEVIENKLKKIDGFLNSTIIKDHYYFNTGLPPGVSGGFILSDGSNEQYMLDSSGGKFLKAKVDGNISYREEISNSKDYFYYYDVAIPNSSKYMFFYLVKNGVISRVALVSGVTSDSLSTAIAKAPASIISQNLKDLYSQKSALTLRKQQLEGLIELEEAEEEINAGNKDYYNHPIVKPDNSLFTSINLMDKNRTIVDASNVERSAGIRYGNKSDVRLEIRYGSDDSLFELKKVYVDYLKTPQNIRLTQAQLDKTEDTSQVLEFPDYVCQEIINELVHVVMENSSNERIQTHPVVSLSIANPTQQLAETQS